MGMIVTLYLISANVYNSVDAPKNRGFSYIEVWMLGSQFPILLALFEYGVVLYLKKVANVSDQNQTTSFCEKIKLLDFVTMISSFCFFIMFALTYCIIALNLDWFSFWIEQPFRTLNILNVIWSLKINVEIFASFFTKCRSEYTQHSHESQIRSVLYRIVFVILWLHSPWMYDN